MRRYDFEKKHMAYRKKYKPYILKYKALVSKYMPYIFREKRHLIFNNLQRHKNSPSHPCRKHRYGAHISRASVDISIWQNSTGTHFMTCLCNYLNRKALPL